MEHSERRPLWSQTESLPAAPSDPAPAITPPRRTSAWKPLGIGVLVGTLLIGAPLGGIAGGLAGSFAMAQFAGSRTTTVTLPNPVPVQPVAVATNTDLTAIYERAVRSVVQVNARGSRGWRDRLGFRGRSRGTDPHE
ncbi:MAG: hypothetical protein KatS3mg060_3207 [Dehalococcoidia bacterium]|nr:MAG: hypothetical protein KatS3mg060_3207 [Dehalococcoidia bacterium]